MTDTKPTPPQERLERETCSRCGGCGNYSRCARYGTICFKCAGKGVTLTKRGAVAMAFLLALRSKPATDLKVGDRIRVTALTRGLDAYQTWATIQSIGPNTQVVQSWVNEIEVPQRTDLLEMEVVYGKVAPETMRLVCIAPESRYTMALSAEAQAETLSAALAYQTTLNKAGKPMKARKT